MRTNETSPSARPDEKAGKEMNAKGLKRTTKNRHYNVYRAMFCRCRNAKHKNFNDYGGRGITICNRWLGPDGFANFVADMGPRPPLYTIERIDNNGPYSPENCRWATREEQRQNRRITVRVTLNGLTLSLVEWAQRLGLSYNTLSNRHKRGWSAERMLSAKRDSRGGGPRPIQSGQFYLLPFVGSRLELLIEAVSPSAAGPDYWYVKDANGKENTVNLRACKRLKPAHAREILRRAAR